MLTALMIVTAFEIIAGFVFVDYQLSQPVPSTVPSITSRDGR